MKNWRKITSRIFSLDMLAYLLVIIYIIIFIFLSFGRYDSLRTLLNDLGTYDQIVWNSLHGKLFQTSAGLYANSDNFSYLSGHFSLILFIFVPFYFIWSSAKMLLLLQIIAVGLGGLPIYWFAHDKTKSKLAGLVFLISYLFYPILHNALLYDFHEVTFTVPFVIFALYFLFKKKYQWMILFLILISLSQEHLTLIVFMFGLYLMFVNKKWKMGIIIAFSSLAYFIVTLTVLMPYFSVTHGVDVIKSPAGGVTRYSWLGSNVGEIIKTVFTEPVWLIKNLLSARRIDFLVTILLPLIGLPLFSGIFLLSLPILGIYFLSSWGLTYSVYFYHSSVLSGIFYFAAILVFTRLFTEIKWQRLFLGLILISSLVISYLYSVTPWGKDFILEEYRPSENAQLIKEVKRLIPPEAALSIQPNLGPHFSARRKLYRFPLQLEQVDYVVVDVFNPYAINSKSFFHFGDVTQINYNDWKTEIIKLFANPVFGIIYSREGWLVFQKGVGRDLNEQAQKDYLEALKKVEASLGVREMNAPGYLQ